MGQVIEDLGDVPKEREALRKLRERARQLDHAITDVVGSGDVATRGEVVYRLEVVQELVELLHGDVSRALLLLSKGL